MESEKTQKIKTIIFWINELKNIQTYREYCDGYKIVYTKPKLRFVSNFFKFEHDIELSDWAKVMFAEWLDNQAKHIQGLIDESDPELVEIARSIIAGDMNSN